MQIDGSESYTDEVTPQKRTHSDHDMAPVSNPSHWEHTTTVNESRSHVAKRARRENLDASPTVNKFGPIIDVADLPPQILQHIFSFVHPVTLGHLLRVCRRFNALLDPSNDKPKPADGNSALTTRKPDEVWARSRRFHLRDYPRPMIDLSELDMWRLIRVRRCQFCGRSARPTPSFLSPVPWTGGPGRDDVRTIWPFRIRACGSCLESRLRKVNVLCLQTVMVS
jgi:hypothetical protein